MVTTYEGIAIWEILCGIVSLIITIIALKRYVEKRSDVARILFFALLMFTCAIFFQAYGTYLNYIINVSNGPLDLSNPQWIQILWIYLVEKFQFSQLFSITGAYGILRLGECIFKREQNKIIIIIHTVFTSFCWVEFIFLLPIFQFNLFDISYWLFIYVIIVMIPMIVGCIRLLKRLEKKDKYFRNVLALLIMSVIFISAMGAFVIETLYEGAINLFSFIAWGLTTLSLVEAYYGFLRRIDK